MIKINLALKKSAVGAEGGAGGLKGFGMVKFDARLDGLKELPIKKIAASVLVAFAASYFLDGYKEDELKKIDAIIPKLEAEKKKLQEGIAKTKGYEPLKKALDADEQMIRTKIETIKTLVADRQTPPKLLMSIATGIPGEVWLNDIKVEEKDVKMHGQSLGFNQISDFMKTLNESQYFTDLRLVNTTQAKDDTGQEVATFELSARRR